MGGGQRRGGSGTAAIDELARRSGALSLNGSNNAASSSDENDQLSEPASDAVLDPEDDDSFLDNEDEGAHLGDSTGKSSSFSVEQLRRRVGPSFSGALDGIFDSLSKNGMSFTPTACLAASLAAISELEVWPLASVCRVASKALENCSASAVQSRASWIATQANVALERSFSFLASQNENSNTADSQSTEAYTTCIKQALNLSGGICSACARSSGSYLKQCHDLFCLCLRVAIEASDDSVRAYARSAAARAFVGARSQECLHVSARMAEAVMEKLKSCPKPTKSNYNLETRAFQLLAACLPAAMPHRSSAGAMAQHIAAYVQQQASFAGSTVSGFRGACAALEAWAGSEHAVVSNEMPEVLSKSLESILVAADSNLDAPEALEASLSCAEQLQRRLMTLDETLGAKKLHHTFHTAVSTLKRGEEGIRGASKRCLLNLIRSCITADLLKQALSKRLESTHRKESAPVPLENCIGSIEQSLGTRFADAWDDSLPVAEALIKRLGSAAGTLASGIIEALGEMEGQSARRAVGAAIKHSGVEQVLSIIPIDAGEAVHTSQGEQGRLWLVELIRIYAHKERTSLFEEKFLPMADECRREADEWKGSQIGKRAQGVEQALWSTLPSLLREGTGEISYSLAKRLEMEARVGRQGIQRAVELTARVLGSEGRGSNLFGLLKVLVERYEQGSVSNVDAIAELAKGRGSAEARGVIAHLAQGAAQGKVSSMRAMLSLSRHMIGALNEETLELSTKAAATGAAAADVKACKRAHLFFSTLIKNSTDNADLRNMALQNHAALILKAANAKPVGAARRARLSFVRELLPLLLESPGNKAERSLHETCSTGNNDSALIADKILGEAVMACKDRNSRARELAYSALERAGEVHGIETTYNKLISAIGTESSSHMSAAAVFSAARLLYKNPERLKERCEKTLPMIMHLAAQAPSSEIAKAALGFIKVASVVLPEENLQRMLKDIMLTLISLDTRRLSTKAKGIVSALLERLGSEELTNSLPRGHEKLVKNVEKQRRRRMRMKSNASDHLDDTSEALSSAKSSSFGKTESVGKGRKSTKTGESALCKGARNKSTFSKAIAPSRASAISTNSSTARKTGSQMTSLPENDEGLDLMNESKMRKLKSSARQGIKLPPGYDTFDEEPAMQEGSDGKLHFVSGAGKRKRADEAKEGDDKPEQKVKKQAGKRKASPEKRTSDTTKFKRGVHHAARFRGKGGGDKSTSGGMQPYAYWPLDRKLLARRRGRKTKAVRELASATGISKG